MARRAKRDMTYAQRVNADLDKFRADIRAEHLAEYQQLNRGDDLAKFKQAQYREALRDAKDAHKAKAS